PVVLSEEPRTQFLPGLLIEKINHARRTMEEAKPAVQKALMEYEQTETLYQRGLDAIRQTAQQATAKAEESFQRITPILEPFEKNAQLRLTGALELLNDSESVGNIENGAAFRDEAARLTPVFSRLA